MPIPTTISVYHGTNLFAAKTIANHGVWLSVQRRLTDFGPGFYVTLNRKQAQKWALVKSREPQAYKSLIDRLNISFDEYIKHPDTRKAAYLVYDIDLTQLKKLNGKCFPLPNHYTWLSHKKEWEQFVKNCINGQSYQFDYVYGPVGKAHKDIPFALDFSNSKDQLSLASEASIQCFMKPTIIAIKEERLSSKWTKSIFSIPSLRGQRMKLDLLRTIKQELMSIGNLSKKEKKLLFS
ncbi:DUF3990 domain-containing protein [Salipaludibacillus sp. CF4.18]|uniref:DUF3990 domain-containing protein n=1 Tax=Salipaludibacillus sp. CF4.18 TaxID=3373081 RepID=UPI003EE6D99E